MALLDIDKLNATPLRREPYDFLVVENFVKPEVFGEVSRDFPSMDVPGSVPPSELDIHGRFAEMLAEMDGPAFRQAVEAKFGIDLGGKPTMFTVRGRCRATDGKIHTDSKSKIITVLLYMNDDWDSDGGRLRILNSDDLNDVAAEVPPNGGTLLIFRRSDTSYHGHEPFEGKRRAIQMNWVTSGGVVAWEQFRHRLSAMSKKRKGAAVERM
ncbi:2OG-Fe(II) oxygenase [Brevundimonas sp.]|uniref:2OG-Fe(II) oxygenase n=1 Tax=Brevundimonas sp. TaxID=1871086 RepID=UPI003919BC42